MLLTFTVKYAYMPDFAIKKKSRWEKTIAWCIHCLVCHLHHNVNEHGHEFLATNGWSAFIASMHDCAWYDRSTNFVEQEVNVPRTIAVRRYGESHGRRKRHVVKPSTTLSQTWYTVIEYHEYLDLSVIRRSITRRCRGQRQYNWTANNWLDLQNTHQNLQNESNEVIILSEWLFCNAVYRRNAEQLLSAQTGNKRLISRAFSPAKQH